MLSAAANARSRSRWSPLAARCGGVTLLASLLFAGAPQASEATTVATARNFAVGSVADAQALDARPEARSGLLVLSAVQRVSQLSIVIERLGADGTPDASFPHGGATIGDLSEMPRTARVLPASSGTSFVVWQTTPTPPDAGDLDAVRVRADGQRDTHWGRGGQISISLTGSTLDYSAVDPAGRLLVAGVRNDHAIVLRYTANGRADATFAGGAWIDAAPSTAVTSLAIDTRSRPVIAETTDSAAGTTTDVRRLDENGSPDITFGLGGVVPLGATTPSEMFVAPRVAVGADDRTLVAYGDSGGDHIARLTSDGALDSTFGSAGATLVAAAAACSATAFDELAATTDDGALTVVHGIATCPVDDDLPDPDRAAYCAPGNCPLTTIALNGNGAPLPDPARGLSAPNLGGGVQLTAAVPLPDGGVVGVGSREPVNTVPGYESSRQAHVERVNANGAHRGTLGERGAVDLDQGGVPEDTAVGLAVSSANRGLLVGSAFAAHKQAIANVEIDRDGHQIRPPSVVSPAHPSTAGPLPAIQSVTSLGHRVVVGYADHCSSATQSAACANQAQSFLTALTPTGRLDRSFGDDGHVRLPGTGDAWLKVFAAPPGIFVLRTTSDGSNRVSLVTNAGRVVRDFGHDGIAELGGCEFLPPTAAWLRRPARLLVAFYCGGSKSIVVSVDASGRQLSGRNLSTTSIDTDAAPAARANDATFATLDGSLILIDSRGAARPLAAAGTLERALLSPGEQPSGLAWSGRHLLVAGTSEYKSYTQRALVATLDLAGLTTRVLRTTVGPAGSSAAGAPTISPNGQWLLGGTQTLSTALTASSQANAFLVLKGH
jgi:uncharacterized delta-60 repeat protein